MEEYTTTPHGATIVEIVAPFIVTESPDITVPSGVTAKKSSDLCCTNLSSILEPVESVDSVKLFDPGLAIIDSNLRVADQETTRNLVNARKLYDGLSTRILGITDSVSCIDRKLFDNKPTRTIPMGYNQVADPECELMNEKSTNETIMDKKNILNSQIQPQKSSTFTDSVSILRDNINIWVQTCESMIADLHESFGLDMNIIATGSKILDSFDIGKLTVSGKDLVPSVVLEQDSSYKTSMVELTHKIDIQDMDQLAHDPGDSANDTTSNQMLEETVSSERRLRPYRSPEPKEAPPTLDLSLRLGGFPALEALAAEFPQVPEALIPFMPDFPLRVDPPLPLMTTDQFQQYMWYLEAGHPSLAFERLQPAPQYQPVGPQPQLPQDPMGIPYPPPFIMEQSIPSLYRLSLQSYHPPPRTGQMAEIEIFLRGWMLELPASSTRMVDYRDLQSLVEDLLVDLWAMIQV